MHRRPPNRPLRPGQRPPAGTPPRIRRAAPPARSSGPGGLVILFITVTILGLGAMIYLLMQNKFGQARTAGEEMKKGEPKTAADVKGVEPPSSAPASSTASATASTGTDLTTTDEFLKKMKEQGAVPTRPEYQSPALGFLQKFTKDPNSIRIKEWSHLKQWRSGVIFGADFSCTNLIGNNQDFRAIFYGDKENGTFRVGLLSVPLLTTDITAIDLSQALDKAALMPDLQNRVKEALK